VDQDLHDPFVLAPKDQVSTPHSWRRRWLELQWWRGTVEGIEYNSYYVIMKYTRDNIKFPVFMEWCFITVMCNCQSVLPINRMKFLTCTVVLNEQLLVLPIGSFATSCRIIKMICFTLSGIVLDAQLRDRRRISKWRKCSYAWAMWLNICETQF